MTKPARGVQLSEPALDEAALAAVRRVLESGWLVQGPQTQAFEKAFARRHGTKRAVAVSSCTAALHLALLAVGIGPGDEVLVPAFTWVATANAVRYCGGEPVLVDVLPDTYNIDPAPAAAAVTPRTRAAIPVHLFGLCADIDALRAVLPDHVAIIEDAACAAGAGYRGRPAGSLGEIGCFSFHPRKSITTGEGGMITTDSEERAALVSSLRNHGLERAPGSSSAGLANVERIGFNYRMTDFQAALGIAQLPRLDDFIEERERWAAWYRRELADLQWLGLPASPPGLRHAWQSFVCVLAEDAPIGRDALIDYLESRGIGARPGTHAVSELPAYRKIADGPTAACPVAARLHRNSIALPLHNRLAAADLEYVAEALHAAGK